MKSFRIKYRQSILVWSSALNISAVIPDGPGALLFFMLLIAISISLRVISLSGPSTGQISSRGSLGFSPFNSSVTSVKYVFHLSFIASSSTRILPPLSLIAFVDCLSCLLLCLAFAILYILSSPSLVFSSWYICCNASPLAIATAFFVFLHIALYVIFSALSCRSFCQFPKAVFLSLTAVCTSSFHNQVSLSFLL